MADPTGARGQDGYFGISDGMGNSAACGRRQAASRSANAALRPVPGLAAEALLITETAEEQGNCNKLCYFKIIGSIQKK